MPSRAHDFFGSITSGVITSSSMTKRIDVARITDELAGARGPIEDASRIALVPP